MYVCLWIHQNGRPTCRFSLERAEVANSMTSEVSQCDVPALTGQRSIQIEAKHAGMTNGVANIQLHVFQWHVSLCHCLPLLGPRSE